MRPRKTIPKHWIREVYGKYKGVKCEIPLNPNVTRIRGKNIFSYPKNMKYHKQYYYRYNGMWYATSYRNMVKRGIIVEV